MSTFDYNEKLHKDTINGNSKEQDRQKGLQEERERNIFILISALRELNIPNIQILEQLVNKYSLTTEEAFEAAKHNYAGCIIWLRSFNIIDDEISDLLINDLGYSPEQAKECLDNTKCFKKTRELNIKRRDK